MINLGVLTEVTDLRAVWPKEALSFTPWLAKEENISLLGDAVGIDIVVEETESSVGDFNVDIYAAEAGTGKKIIIENQLEDTDHEHLGKLITYASGKDASIIIWVVKKARDEHKAAVEWLNAHTDDSVGFFLCEIKLYKIGNSDPAVKFDVVEKPNDWAREIKKSSQVTNETEQLRLDYWQAYLNYLAKKKPYPAKIKPAKAATDHWLSHYFGTSLCHIVANQIQKRNEIIVEIYISDNKEFYRKLYAQKADIESKLGFELDWRELPDRKASRILITKENVNFGDTSDWDNQFGWISEKVLQFYNVVKEFI